MSLVRAVLVALVTIAVCVVLALILEPIDHEHDRPPHAEPSVARVVRPRGGPSQETPGSTFGNLEQVSKVLAYIEQAQRAEERAAVARAEAEEQARIAAARVARPGVATPLADSPSPAGVDDTLACIRAHESDMAGGYQAVNPSSQAGGAYQALPSTWDGYGGYPRAELAPPEVQDAWAHEALAAAGTRPWAGSGC